MNIGNFSLAAELDGQVCFVLVPPESRELLLRFVAGLSKDGMLKAIKAPSDFKFENLMEHMK